MERGRGRYTVIARYWSATATPEKAPLYANYFKTAVVAELERLPGYQGGKLLERETSNGVEIVVITFWDSLNSIRAFAGNDIERAAVADEAAALLGTFDRRVKHFEVIAD